MENGRLNNTGSIPKLTGPAPISTINAYSFLTHGVLESKPVVTSAWGPEQPNLKINNDGSIDIIEQPEIYPQSWFPATDVLRIMQCIRVLYEHPVIEVYFYLAIGSTGEYTYNVHTTFFNLDIVVTEGGDCGLLFGSSVHTTSPAFLGRTVYATEFITSIKGSNQCASAGGSSNNWIQPAAITELLYTDFYGPNGDAGVNDAWELISGGFLPAKSVSEDGGYPRLIFTPNGPNSVGVSYPFVTGPIFVDGRSNGNYGPTFPPTSFSIGSGYIRPLVTDPSLQPTYWDRFCNGLNPGVMPGKYTIPQYDSFKIAPTSYQFLRLLMPFFDESYFGTAIYIVYIVSQPIFSDIYSSDIEMIAYIQDNYKNFAAFHVLMYTDVGYIDECGGAIIPGLSDQTLSYIANFCEEMSPYGFEDGGAVIYELADNLVKLVKKRINAWFAVNPSSKPGSPNGSDGVILNPTVIYVLNPDDDDDGSDSGL